ncbi:acyl-CoA thioesterase [Muricauda sp. JGD-17]|uniref:Acyl-CoA thioesterase n=1 Tax=Flagellimonas ochracea TaxID=2696472 RepID=A0A964WWM4_9FLAO|nr:acyl-ACP thioesterase domain-containing protein [Allomuricauda ochracea]NAY90744.1 acyl-CoA thioesterase [Allomuricauda ochracea]
MRRYSEVREVTQDDLDELKHVNNVRYVQWIQDISKSHWFKVTSPEIRQKMIWVVKNHNITYHQSAVLGDSVALETYIKENKGPISTRIVEIKNNKTGQLLVSASTEWCLLNGQSFRPKRVPESVKELFQ